MSYKDSFKNWKENHSEANKKLDKSDKKEALENQSKEITKSYMTKDAFSNSLMHQHCHLPCRLIVASSYTFFYVLQNNETISSSEISNLLKIVPSSPIYSTP